MGCGGSKVDDLALVKLCRERKDLIKAASDHRYAFAASHVSYFRSLKHVGDALRRFVDEELIIGVVSSSSPSSPSSPVLTLPSDQGKKKSSGSTSTSLTHSASASLSHHHHSPPDNDNDNDSHLHFATSTSETDDSISAHHLHENEPEFQPYSSPPPQMNSTFNNGFQSYSYYMKRSSTKNPTFVYQEPTQAYQWSDSSHTQSGYSQYGGMGGMGGYGSVPPPPDSQYDPYYNRPPQSPLPPAVPPSPPSPPKYSSWEFLNPFEVENAYGSYYSGGRYEVGSISSSTGSEEVRQREGIPDLEDDTEQEPVKEFRKDKQKVEENSKKDFGEGTSTGVPLQKEDKEVTVDEKEIKSSSESIVSKSTGEEEISLKKGVSFEVDEQSAQDRDSSMPSSLTTLSTQGQRDLQEAVQEIRDEFQIASEHGKEVAMILEVDKLPYHSRNTILKVISSRILNLIVPPVLTSSHPPSKRSQRTAASIMKMAKDKSRNSEEFQINSGSLSSTLERLYAWEKKLYKEVKDEERLRVMYEKKCKRLKLLDVRGAESSKIEATEASIRKLLTRINVAIKTVEAIAIQIHKLRDEVLQPQITQLIHSLIRMWKAMLKCHQKQFQAIMESKSRTLMAKTSARSASSLRATVDLELELLNWCTHFTEWIATQKAYIETLNGWLMLCLYQEEENSVDGKVPFSPSRAGAPPVFIICNDWYHAVDRLSETEVANSMHAFALSLHQLWERQDEEQRQRVKAEYLFKDFEKRLRTLRKEEMKKKQEQQEHREESTVSVGTESGVSALDDLKVDLDSMRKRLEEEKARHKETVKQVHEAASSSLQAGLVPIFDALGKFSSETLKAYEQVRIRDPGGGGGA